MKESFKSMYIRRISDYFELSTDKYVKQNYEKSIKEKSKVFKDFGIFDKYGRYEKEVKIDRKNSISKSKLLGDYRNKLVKTFYQGQYNYQSYYYMADEGEYNHTLHHNIKKIRACNLKCRSFDKFKEKFKDDSIENFNYYLNIGYIVYEISGLIVSYLRTEDIIDNKAKEDIPIEIEQYKKENIEFKIMKNEKILKAIKRIIKELIKKHYIKKENIKELYKYIEYFSDIVCTSISEKIATHKSKKYKMLISYNPYDILTMSDEETTAGRWRSCLAWYNGEYGSGAVGYGTDDKTLVVKFNNCSEKTELRFLVHYDKDQETFIVKRSYPRDNYHVLLEEDIHFCKTILNEIYKLRVTEEDIRNLDNKYILELEEQHYSKNKYATYKKIAGGYVDSNRYILNPKQIELKYKGFETLDSFKCIHCGESRTAQLTDRRLYCFSCARSNKTRCNYCGKEAEHYINGDYLCKEHYKTETKKCKECNVTYIKSTIHEDFEDVCIHCVQNYEEYIKCSRCGKTTKDKHNYNGYNYCTKCATYRGYIR